MRTVKVTLESTEEHPVEAVLRVEARATPEAPFHESSVSTVKSGDPSASRSFVLEDNERLVIEPVGRYEDEIVYDREQGAAMRRSAYEEQKRQTEAPASLPSMPEIVEKDKPVAPAVGAEPEPFKPKPPMTGASTKVEPPKAEPPKGSAQNTLPDHKGEKK